MGRRGPAKTPAAVKRSRGTFRADRDAGVELPAGQPRMPAWLSETAAELWRELAPQLVRENLLTPLDGIVFALLCDTYATFLECGEWLGGDVKKMFVEATRTNNDGEEIGSSVYQHPLVGVWHKSRNDLLRLSREFGMTPSSRCGMRLGNKDDADDDPIAALSKRFEQLLTAGKN